MRKNKLLCGEKEEEENQILWKLIFNMQPIFIVCRYLLDFLSYWMRNYKWWKHDTFLKYFYCTFLKKILFLILWPNVRYGLAVYVFMFSLSWLKNCKNNLEIIFWLCKVVQKISKSSGQESRVRTTPRV